MTGFTFSKYRAVIFDLDSTLTDTHRYPLRASMWLLEQCTDDLEGIADEYLNHLIANYRKGIREIVDGADYRRPFDVVKRAIAESLEEVGLSATNEVLEEGTKLFQWLHVETSTAYPGIEDFLEQLASIDMKLGVITNSFEKHLQLILSNLNLLHYFACLVDGGDVKAFKPMKKPFLRMIDCLGVDVAQILFVGDEYYADIVGATSVGMDAVWVNSRNVNLDDMIEKHGEPSRPLLMIRAVTELKEYL